MTIRRNKIKKDVTKSQLCKPNIHWMITLVIMLNLSEKNHSEITRRCSRTRSSGRRGAASSLSSQVLFMVLIIQHELYMVGRVSGPVHDWVWFTLSILTNIRKYLCFTSPFDTEKSPVAEVYSKGGKKYSTLWLLMAWWYKGPRHQRQWHRYIPGCCLKLIDPWEMW